MNISVLFICFWVIALFISLKEFRLPSDIWIALCLVLYGFGGLANLLTSVLPAPCNARLSAFALSLSAILSPYALLIYALYYTDRMPIKPIWRNAVILGSAVPLLCVYLFTPYLSEISEFFFSAEETWFFQRILVNMLPTTFFTVMAIVTLYIIIVIGLLSQQLFSRSTAVWRCEAMSEYIFVVITALSFYAADVLLPCFGYYSFWRMNTGIIIVQSLVFILLVFRRNILGFSYFAKNMASEQVRIAVVSGVSILQHALKNNIFAIKVALQNVQFDYAQGTVQPAALKNNVQIAQNSCTHLLSVLERIDQSVNPTGVTAESCAIVLIIEDVLQQCQPMFTEKSIIVWREYGNDPKAYCDPIHIREVFQNLINNASEALDNNESPEIRISIQQTKHRVIINIADNGCGMDKKQLKKAGTPLITSKKGGTHYGLGLYYVHKVIAMSDGSFSLEHGQNGGIVAHISLLVG